MKRLLEDENRSTADTTQDHEQRLPLQRPRRQPSTHDLGDREVQEDRVRGQRAQARSARQRRDQERAAFQQEPPEEVALHSISVAMKDMACVYTEE